MQTNFLIIGSGVSGLNFALKAAKKGEVILVTKKKIIDSNTNFAQGGIAAVIDKTDDAKQHIKDTLEAGAYHNNIKLVHSQHRCPAGQLDSDNIMFGLYFSRLNIASEPFYEVTSVPFRWWRRRAPRKRD